MRTTPRTWTLIATGATIAGCQLINGVADLEVDGSDATSASSGAAGGSGNSGGTGPSSGGAGGNGASGGTGASSCDDTLDVAWARNYGDTQTQQAFGVAVDSLGRTWIAGHAEGTFPVGEDLIDVMDPPDLFYAKLDEEGVPTRAGMAGGFGRQIAWAVAVDPGDNVYLAGEYESGIDPIARLPFARDADLFVAKLDKLGNPVWGQGYFGAALEGQGANLAFSNNSAGVIVGANYTAAMDFGPANLVTPEAQDFFLLRLEDQLGALQLLTDYGGPGNQSIIGLAAAPLSGRIAVVGQYEGELAFGVDALPMPRGGFEHGFVALLDQNHNELFSSPIGGGSTVAARAVAFAPNGDLVVAGIFFDNVEFEGGGTLVAVDGIDGFVARFQADGTVTWVRALGGSGDQVPTSVAVAPNGTIWVGGLVDKGSLDCGCGPQPNGGGMDAFLARFDSQGEQPFCRQAGDAAEQRITGLAIGPGGMRLSGFFGGVLDFGAPFTLSSEGGFDMFVAGVAPPR